MVAPPFHVSAQSVLFDACKALQDPSKRADCFEEIARQKGPTTAPASRFDGVRKATQMIESSLAVGLNQLTYVSLVQQLRFEVDTAFREKSPDDEPVERALRASLEAHSDALQVVTVWNNFYAKRGNSTTYAWGIPYALVGLEWVTTKYSVPTANADLLGFSRGFLREDALSEIWKVAKKHSQSAFDTIEKNQRPASKGVLSI